MRRRLACVLLTATSLAMPALAQSPPAPAKKTAAPTAKSTAPRQILLQADAVEVEYEGSANTFSAVGHVQIIDEGRILLADRVTYYQDTDKVTADGHVSLTDPKGDVSFFDHLVLTDHMRNGVLDGFGALIGTNGRLAAVSAERRNGTIIIGNRAVYSPCKICNQPGQRTPLWQVKAERVVYDQEKHNVRFRDATIEAFGVPVLYSPYLSVPDPSVRYASGFLTPVLGNSSTLGYFTRLPYYVSISPSQDLTLEPMFSTLAGDLGEAEFRSRWNDSGLWLQGSIGYNPNGGLGGGNTSGAQVYDHLFGSGRIALGDNWRTGFDLQLTNNSAYMQYYNISYLDRLTSDLFLENDSGRSRLAMTAYFFQGLRSTDVTSLIPYVAPLLEYNFIPDSDVLGGQFRFDANAMALSRGSGDDEQRATGEMSWRLPMMMGAGQLWTIVADVRGDSYRLTAPVATSMLPAGTTYVGRAIPYLALDWRWPFLAESQGGRSYVLEPIAQLVAQPYGGNPAALRNEDSSDFEFSDTNVFDFQQLPGYDVVESGPRANIGFNAEALFPGGEVQALVGQTYRLKPDPVLASFAGVGGDISDVVGSFSVKFPHLDITDRIDLDRGDASINRQDIYITGTYNRSSVQVSYEELPPLPLQTVPLGLGAREEISIQMDLNIYQNWQVFMAARRDLLANQFIDTESGLGYEDECLGISLAYRRKYTSDAALGVPPSTTMILRFSFKTGETEIKPFSLFPRDVFSNIHS